jgi:hypothetical protein
MFFAWWREVNAMEKEMTRELEKARQEIRLLRQENARLRKMLGMRVSEQNAEYTQAEPTPVVPNTRPFWFFRPLAGPSRDFRESGKRKWLLELNEFFHSFSHLHPEGSNPGGPTNFLNLILILVFFRLHTANPPVSEVSKNLRKLGNLSIISYSMLAWIDVVERNFNIRLIRSPA